MATTQIGLTATLDISDFQRNAATYMATLRQMQTAAGQTQTSTSASFAQMGGLGNSVIPSLDSIGKGFLAIGAAATAAAVGGVALLASSSIQMASDFEQSLADIAARMRETVDSITPLRDEIYSIALNPDLKVSMVEASEASLMLASAGITMEQQLGGALQKTIEFQNAVGGDFKVAANVAIMAMDTFGLGADQLGAAVDGATGAINRSKLDAQKYTYVLGNAGTAFMGVGGTLGEFNTVAAVTASVFATGQRQGSAMAEMLNRMAVPTKQGEKTMNALGISFWTSTGRARQLYDVVDDLRDRLKGMTEEQRREAIVDIFGKRGEIAMSAMLTKTGDELRTLQAEVNASGQAAAAAATRMDTLQGAFGAFNDMITATATSIGGMLTPLLKNSFQSINESFTPLVKAFDLFGLSGVANTLKLSDASVEMATSIDESFKKLYATLSAGGIIAALNQMGISTDTLAISFYGLTGALIGLTTLGAIAASVWALGVAFAAITSPIGILIGSVALLGAAWNTNFLGMNDVVRAWVTMTQSEFDEGIKAWRFIFDQVPIFIGKAFEKTSEYVKGFISIWPDWMQVVMNAMYDIVVSGLSLIQAELKRDVEAWQGIFDRLGAGIELPNFGDIGGAFPGIGDSFEGLTSSFAIDPSVAQSFDVGAQSVYRFQAATTAATQSATTAKLAFADENSGLLEVADSAGKAGKAATKMADDVVKAREKISDTNLSMANLRGEIAQLENQFPGLTQEIIDNFNAHTAAGNSVASFGDKLGATERRQMFNYLTKLIDMNAANEDLMASNGLVDSSLTTVGDGFMDLVETMSTGLGDPLAELPVVASLAPPVSPDTAATTQGLTDSSAAMTAINTAAVISNPLLTTMAGIYNESLNPALLLASTYLPIISQAWVTINEAITLLTSNPLPLLATTLNDTVNPALLATQTQTDILSNTSLSGLTNMILSQVMPSLGQIFTALGTQVTPALFAATAQSDLLTASFLILIDAGKEVVTVSEKIYKAGLKELEIVEELIDFYLALAEARREANRAMGTGGTPVPADGGAGFARGGSFVVPSGYPSGGYGMPMRVHSGELVKVFTAAQTRQMNRTQPNSRIVSNSNSTTNNKNSVVNFNITTQQPSKSILSDLAFAKAKYGVF